MKLPAATTPTVIDAPRALDVPVRRIVVVFCHVYSYEL
jgi:hypothetical protein